MNQKLEMIQGMAQKQELRLQLMGKIKVAEFLSLPESEFESYINDVEEDPLFTNLRKKYGIIRYRKFSGVKETRTARLKDEILDGGFQTNTEDLLSDPAIFQLVKKVGNTIGEENFKKIIKGEGNIREIIEQCDLSSSEVEAFQEFVNKFQLQQIINPVSPSFSSSAPGSRFFLIAAFEWEKDNLIIHPVKQESYLVKGKYNIDYERFKQLIKTNKIGKSEAEKMMKIFRKLEMINRRSTTIYRILNYLKKLQCSFFKSGKTLDLFPCSQSELSRHLNLNPSTVNRAITRKSILTPHREEKAITFFFSRRWTKNLIKKIILQERQDLLNGNLRSPLTDSEIQQKVLRVYGRHLSRRSITKYRRMMDIPPSHRRYEK